MFAKLITLVILLHCACFALAQCPWEVEGAVYWSDANTWAPNPVPVAGSNVVLPAGPVIYDVTTPGITFAGITVNAGSALIFDGTKNVVLETAWLVINYGANFSIGSSSCPYPTKASITLHGAYDPNTNIVPHLGTKGIFVLGLVEWFGTPPQPTWTNVVATVNVGDTQITVKDALTNWNVGDMIALASTDYYQDLTEEFQIVAISGNTITLDRPTLYMHYGAENQFAEVGHLTRNILIMGDSQSDAQGFGGHCIVNQKGIAHVKGVEFTKMGQKGVLARYPFHFHYMGDQIGKGHFIEENSFHHNYQRCLTVHGTSGVFVQNNVGFNVTGHCYFLEEGSETWNTYNHNLGMVVNPGPMIYSDQTPSIFWITNPNNTFTNNVAVGGEFGFWFSLPLHPIGMSAGQTNVYPRYTPLLQFDNNLAHSADDSGIFQDNGPDPTGNTAQETSYQPLMPPYTSDSQTWNTAPVRATLSGNVAYKCRQHGIWLRGSQMTVQNSLLMDNGVGVNMPATGNLVKDTVIIGQTDNIGTPGHTQWFDDQGRSRPVIWWASFPIHGFEGYDNTGGQFGRNITFVNFISDDVRRAGAIGQITGGIFVLPATDMFAQITLINSNAFATPDTFWGEYYYNYDGPLNIVFLDTDGSLTGAYGNAITSNGSIVQEGGCVPVLDWNNYWNCSRSPNGFSYIQLTNNDIGNTNFGDSLSWTYRAAFIPFGRPDVINNVTGGDPRNTERSEYASNVISRKGYLLKFPHPTPYNTQLTLHFASTGEWIVLAMQYPAGTTFNIQRGYANTQLIQVSSLSFLNKNTYFFDDANEYLYVMYYEDDGSLVDNTGFPEYGWGSSYLNIVASCGSSCAVTADHAVPDTYPDTEDRYQVSLFGTSSSKEGYAYFYFNQNTHVVTYIIYHNIPTATTAGILINGVEYQHLPVGQAPIRGSFEISWNKWNALFAGSWTVVIRSQDYPTGELTGSLSCVGTCSAPPSNYGNAQICAAVSSNLTIYAEALNQYGGWQDWSWGTIRNYTFTDDVACGVNSLQVLYSTWGAITFHVGNGGCNPGQCTASWMSPYVFLAPFINFEFYVKSPNGPLPTPLVVSVQNSAGTTIGSVVVNYTYIDNFIIEETWTKVSIPLGAFGCQPTDLIGIFSIQMQAQLTNYPVIYDNILLVAPDGTPATTTVQSHLGAGSNIQVHLLLLLLAAMCGVLFV